MSDFELLAKQNAWNNTPLFSNFVLKNPQKVNLFSDRNAQPLSILTIPFDPNSGNVLTGINGSGTVNGGVSARSGYLNYSQLYVLNKSNGFMDPLEEPTAISTVVLPSASSTTLVAAGGAGKQYKLFSAFITCGNVAGTVTINEITSGTLILGANSVAAAASETVSIPFGTAGVLQPTANNGIQVTTSAASLGYAGIVYGAAR